MGALSVFLFLSLLQLITPFSAKLAPRLWLKHRTIKSFNNQARTVSQIEYFRGGKIATTQFINDDLEDDEDDDVDDDELNGGDSSPLQVMRRVTLPPIIRDTWRSTPPLTRSFLAASLLLTTLSSVFNNNEFPAVLEMDLSAVVQQLQLWRPLTAFLYLGPLGLGGWQLHCFTLITNTILMTDSLTY
jgi:hypothetical protein